MLRTVRRCFALAAIPAALALTVVSAPAATAAPSGIAGVSGAATPDGSQRVIGIGYAWSNLQGRSHPLKDVGSTCTTVDDTRSAENFADSGRVITLYREGSCTTPWAVIVPGDAWPWIAEVGATGYTTSPE